MKTWVAFVLAGLPGSPSQYIQSSNPAHVFLLAVPQLASKLAFFFSVFAWFLVFLAGREIVRDRETERQRERERERLERYKKNCFHGTPGNDSKHAARPAGRAVKDREQATCCQALHSFAHVFRHPASSGLRLLENKHRWEKHVDGCFDSFSSLPWLLAWTPRHIFLMQTSAFNLVESKLGYGSPVTSVPFSHLAMTSQSSCRKD